METAFSWNIALFHLINASASPAPAIVGVAKFFANDGPWVTIAVLVLFWLFGTVAARRALMCAGVALAVGLAINFTIALVHYEPRPAVAGIGHTLLAHGPETSFPSDHATFILSLGFALLMARPLRRLGVALVLLGAATAWARVFLGVHFPLDMIASTTISVIAALAAVALRSVLEAPFFSRVERLNDRIFARFRRQ